MNENEKLLENVDVPYSTRELKVIQESNKKKDHMINLICNIIFTVIYLSSLTYGIIRAFDPEYQSKAFLIIIESFFCSIIPIGYFLVEKYFRLELKPSIRIGIEIFALLGSVVGETFEFYYRVNNFDKFFCFSVEGVVPVVSSDCVSIFAYLINLSILAIIFTSMSFIIPFSFEKVL